MSAKLEAQIQAEGLIALSALLWQGRRAVPIIFRMQGGTFTTLDGNRIVKIGIDGVTDAVGVLCDGRALFVEWKTETGRMRPAQLAFRDQAIRSNAVHIVARSAEFACAQVLDALGRAR